MAATPPIDEVVVIAAEPLEVPVVEAPPAEALEDPPEELPVGAEVAPALVEPPTTKVPPTTLFGVEPSMPALEAA